jgi:hypothetical protein
LRPGKLEVHADVDGTGRRSGVRCPEYQRAGKEHADDCGEALTHLR